MTDNISVSDFKLQYTLKPVTGLWLNRRPLNANIKKLKINELKGSSLTFFSTNNTYCQDVSEASYHDMKQIPLNVTHRVLKWMLRIFWENMIYSQSLPTVDLKLQI